MSRRGQGVFRKNVEQIEKSCRVTGLRDLQHLRASHIKPWKDSDDQEKVDGHNGLMLSPHVDHLFDRGWILFEDNGMLVPSPKLDVLVLQSWRIEPDRQPRPFLPRQIEYLEYHRELVFQH
jgi:predicted restriction endonuclease